MAPALNPEMIRRAAAKSPEELMDEYLRDMHLSPEVKKAQQEWPVYVSRERAKRQKLKSNPGKAKAERQRQFIGRIMRLVPTRTPSGIIIPREKRQAVAEKLCQPKNLGKIPGTWAFVELTEDFLDSNQRPEDGDMIDSAHSAFAPYVDHFSTDGRRLELMRQFKERLATRKYNCLGRTKIYRGVKEFVAKNRLPKAL